jgi:hypothetical protein
VPIGSVRRLHLFLNRNEIARLPEQIADLDNIVFLYCEYNRMESLPRALAGMDSLEGMYFTANRFIAIPDFEFEMVRLKKASVFQEPDYAVARGDRQSQGTAPFQHRRQPDPANPGDDRQSDAPASLRSVVESHRGAAGGLRKCADCESASLARHRAYVAAGGVCHYARHDKIIVPKPSK